MLTLSRGSRLGPYEIRAVLGAGSMGEVYRARDTRMGRNVAIKVLGPPMLAKGPVQLQRFELEARAAGSLNHPNLLTVHDFGTHQDARYLVTEFLEGETLRDVLDPGPVPARKAIDFAIQIARGLSAAHEKGILHRDLKPDNIFVTKDQRIKILDFGLAKLIEPELHAQLLGEHRLTTPGVVMGTARYMSPEQARDLPLDQRSDLFSVGVLLYEMLSGHQPFRGNTPMEAMTAIAKHDPPELVYPGEQVPGLDLIVHHCLEKSPDNRVQSARDLIFQLETVVSGGAEEPVAPPKKRPLLLPGLLALALLAPVAAFFAGRRASASVLPSFHKLTFRRGSVEAARFAPDGQTVVYSAAWDDDRLRLFSTRPESPESRELGIADEKILSVSLSGELAILHGLPVGTLARVPLAGGAPRELLEGVFEADWAPDGASLAVVRVSKGRNQLEYPAGKVLYETGGWISGARVSRSGELIAFIDHPALGYSKGSVAVVDRTGRKRTLTPGWIIAQGLAWSASGDEIWFTAGNVAGVTAVQAVDLSGKGRMVAPSTGNLTLQDVSPDGHLLLSQSSLRLMLMVQARDQPSPRDLSWMDGSWLADLSEDGKTLLFLEAGEAQAAQNAGGAIYLRNTDGSPAVKLGEGSVSRLSPDGRWVLAAPGPEFSRELLMLPTGAGDPVAVPLGGITLTWDPVWFPDGKRILARAKEGQGKSRLYVLELAGGKPRPVTPEGTGAAFLLSPDGLQVAAQDEQHKLILYPLSGGEPRPVPDAEPADMPVGWAADGAALFVYQPREKPALIRRLDLATGKKQPWKPLALPDPAGTGPIFAAHVTADGNSYAYNYEINLQDLYLVDGVR